MNTFNELIKSTKTTSGKIDKEEMIRSFFNKAKKEEIEKLRMYCDPDFVVNFSKAMIKKAEKSTYNTNPNIVSVEYVLNKLHNRQWTGNDAIRIVGEQFKKWNTTDKEDFIIIATRDTTGFTLTSVNNVYESLHGKKFITMFECQLANKYDPEKYYKYGDTFAASRKYDGLRCLFYNGKFHTRNNKPIVGFDIIERQAAWIMDNFDIDFLDGELYSSDIPFEQIQGAVMRDVNIDEDMKRYINYNVFAAYNPHYTSTRQMLDTICKIKTAIEKEFKNESRINIVEQFIVDNNPSKIKQLCEQFVAEGYEGVMLRDTTTCYDFKRSNALLKFKLFVEDDFICTDVFEGEGDLKNMLGGIYIKSSNGKIKCKCGSGFNDAQRKLYWNDPTKIIGKLCEIKYQNITEDNSLRFPVFRRVKEDR